MKYLFYVAIIYFFIDLTPVKANNAEVFNYNQELVAQQLQVATAAEIDFNNNNQSSNSIKEKYKLSNLFSYNYSSQRVPDLGYISFVAGCCVGLPGLAVVSLQYYNQSGGNSSNGSYGTASIGAIFLLVVIAGIYIYAIDMGII
jgi:hypothetical protein